MKDLTLELKQIVDYPRCRMYRQFVQSLMQDRSIRVSGGSVLFYYTVLCSYANFRTSYRRLHGFGYTVYPGEWICTVKELTEWFRTRFQWQAINILEKLQKIGLISFICIGRAKVIKYRITDWNKHNTVLDYNCPCQKESGFFFMPITVTNQIISSEHCSEMDILLDLWISAIYNDTQVEGSSLAPVVYMRNGTGNPLVSYSYLAHRWGISKTSVSRILQKFQELGHIHLLTFPGRTGTVIYLQNYLSVMFQVSDVMIDKEAVAMALHIKLSVPQDQTNHENALEQEIIVPDELFFVPESHITLCVSEIQKILEAQGLFCAQCEQSMYMLFPLSAGPDDIALLQDLKGEIVFGVRVICGNGQAVRAFKVTLSLLATIRTGGAANEKSEG